MLATRLPLVLLFVVVRRRARCGDGPLQPTGGSRGAFDFTRGKQRPSGLRGFPGRISVASLMSGPPRPTNHRGHEGKYRNLRGPPRARICTSPPAPRAPNADSGAVVRRAPVRSCTWPSRSARTARSRAACLAGRAGPGRGRGAVLGRRDRAARAVVPGVQAGGPGGRPEQRRPAARPADQGGPVTPTPSSPHPVRTGTFHSRSA